MHILIFGRHRQEPVPGEPDQDHPGDLVGYTLGTRVSQMKIYVGNLSFQTSEAELNSTFSEFGEVQSANLIMDRETGRPRGFGFIEMGDDEGRRAIEELNGKDLDGRPLTVNEAKPRESRGGGGGGGGGGRGGYGGGGGGGGGGGRW